MLALNAKLRSEIIPGEAVNVDNAADEQGDAPHPSFATRISWARLLRRVFDIEHCPQCGGDLKIIAAIYEPPAVIAKIPAHLCLPTRAPPRHRPRHSISFKRPDANRYPSYLGSAC